MGFSLQAFIDQLRSILASEDLTAEDKVDQLIDEVNYGEKYAKECGKLQQLYRKAMTEKKSYSAELQEVTKYGTECPACTEWLETDDLPTRGDQWFCTNCGVEILVTYNR